MTRRGIIAWLTCFLVGAAAVVAPSASAAGPTIERFDVDETFLDEFLTDACGVEVLTRAQGQVAVRAFSGDGTGPVEVFTLNVALTAMAGDNTYRFRDLGLNLERVEPDGTAVLSVVGQVPFTFIGVLKIDLETGDAILEPQHSLEGNLEDACAALTA